MPAAVWDLTDITTRSCRDDVYRQLHDLQDRVQQLRKPPLRESVLGSTNSIGDQELGYWIESKAIGVRALRFYGGGPPMPIVEGDLVAFSGETGKQQWCEHGSGTGGRSNNDDAFWQKLHEKLKAFAELKPGWDGYSAPAPSPNARVNVQEFLGTLSVVRLRPDRFKPSVVGGVGLTFRKGARKAYVEFYNDGRVHALFSDAVTEPMTETVRPGPLGYLRLITDIRKHLNA